MRRTKKFGIVLCTAVFTVIAGTAAVWGHGGNGHHPEPGYDAGRHDCYLGGNFHNYDHQSNYGADKNVWCNGRNPQLAPHHGGNTVKAALPANNSFDGGFCIKADLSDQAAVLNVDYKDVVAHDKVWLLNKVDSNYYPIDRATGETSIQIEDNGWADQNLAEGQVEAEVLFSTSTGGTGNNPIPGGNPPSGGNPASGDGGGGGCNLLGASSWIGMAFLFLVPPLFLRKQKESSLPGDIKWR
jgi:hypothetical protein